jgi:hypothetical protein
MPFKGSLNRPPPPFSGLGVAPSLSSGLNTDRSSSPRLLDDVDNRGKSIGMSGVSWDGRLTLGILGVARCAGWVCFRLNMRRNGESESIRSSIMETGMMQMQVLVLVSVLMTRRRRAKKT